MADVLHQFVINAEPRLVWDHFTTGDGLAKWWTARSSGDAVLDAVWQLYFMPGYDWRALVTVCEPQAAFELTLIDAMDDWIGTRVGVVLRDGGEGLTVVDFYHRGWAAETDHFRISSFCWATYLRLLKRYIEHGEFTPYGQRDFV